MLYSNSNIPQLQLVLFIPFSRGTDSLGCSLFVLFVSQKAVQFWCGKMVDVHYVVV
jgi:hypothetical protein